MTISHNVLGLAPLVGKFALLAAVVGPCLLAERILPGRRQRPAGRMLNLGIGLASMFAGAASAGSVGVLATLAVNAAGGGWIVLPSTGWALVWAFAAYLLAMDLGEYLFHRAQHAIPALWEMHTLHHSDPAFGVTTAVRHFWLESLIKSLTIWLAVGLIFKTPLVVAEVYAAISTYNFWTHANVKVGYGRLSWLLNSPQYHRLHHSAQPEHFDCNYAALLPIFDLISGAYRRPGAEDYPATGLDSGEHPGSLVQAVTWPLRDGAPLRRILAMRPG